MKYKTLTKQTIMSVENYIIVVNFVWFSQTSIYGKILEILKNRQIHPHFRSMFLVTKTSYGERHIKYKPVKVL